MLSASDGCVQCHCDRWDGWSLVTARSFDVLCIITMSRLYQTIACRCTNCMPATEVGLDRVTALHPEASSAAGAGSHALPVPSADHGTYADLRTCKSQSTCFVLASHLVLDSKRLPEAWNPACTQGDGARMRACHRPCGIHPVAQGTG
jgi:hypothetical protein